ncbi:sensor histidine kinase [Roseivirga sp.]|uniref:sensor histidine kinase n=1 Tax=Roseivirga sp. TaxID=1964215 RepID=UPI002B2757ED|nr:sensor histidine kinase [Roseivirga sp.]
MKFAHYLIVIALLFSTAFQEKKDSTPNISGPEQVLRELEGALSSTPFDSHQIFKLYSEAAQHLAIRGSYKEADSLFIKADALSIHESDSIEIMEMNLSRANMYKEQGKYTAALQTYMEALVFYQKRKDVNAQLWVYGYLVEFYRATYNEDLSLKFIEEAENLMMQNEVEIRPKAYFYHAKAAYFLQFQIKEISTSFKETRAYLEQALTLAESTGDSYLIGLNLNGLGFLLMHNNPSESSEIVDYLESAKGYMLANERYRNYTSVLQTLSLYYTRSGHPEMAVELTFEAIELSKKNSWSSNLGDLYRLAGEVYYELGIFKESAVYLNMALEATKESMDKIHSIELSELTTSYEKAIAEQKLSEQQIETEIAQKQAVNNRKALITTVIISVILLTISIVSVVLYNRFRKANTQLRTQEEITRKTNDELNNAVEQKNVLYKELNHRVKNNLTVLSSLIHIQEDGEKNETQRELYQTLRHRIQSMALVHQNLYQLDEALNINFQQYLRKLIPSIASAFNIHHDVGTTIRCENLIVNMDEAVPIAMIINELITNSFKYAFENGKNGKIELWSEVEKDKRHIHYKDNGPGMPIESKTAESQKLGMTLIRLMVQQLNGELIYNGDKSGLYFIIELPLLQRS